MTVSILAHGVGSRGTLPLPLWQFAWAASAALVLSFVALGVLWKEPKLAALSQGRRVPVPVRVLDVLEWTVRIGGVALFGLALATAFFGVDSDTANLTPVTIYVIVWVGVAVVAALFGDVWKVMNPFETVAKLFPERTANEAPHHRWVATALMFGFLVLELVHPSGSSPLVLGWAMVIYTLAMVLGMGRYGRVWLDRADGFGLLFSLLGAMGIFFRGTEGELRIRPPLSGLYGVSVIPATGALVLTVLGGTSFDGFSESPMFTDIIGRPSGWGAFTPKLIGLIVIVLIATLLYWIGARATANVTGSDHVDAAAMFVPSLVPIVFGYAVAHYAQLLIDETQSFWFRLSNPFGYVTASGAPEADWFGAATGTVDLNLVNVDVIAWIQALAIVVGHVAGVLFAHDLAVSKFDGRIAARSQQTMLLVMVIYSIAGLWLLFSA